MLHSSTSSSRRKAPSLDPEDFASWSMMFQAHVGFEEWELFNKEEPQVHEDTLLDLLAANGDDTEASLRYEKKIRVEQKKWKRNSDQIRQQLVEALCENKQTKLMALEFQNLPTWGVLCSVDISCEGYFISIFELSYWNFECDEMSIARNSN